MISETNIPRWAWQHTNVSRHKDTDGEDNGNSKSSQVRICPRTGRATSRAPRKRSGASMTDHLAHLHSLLRSTYFSSWPLEVRFFSMDVFRVWSVWSERVDGVLTDNIKITLDANQDTEDAASQTSNGSAHMQKLKQLDIGYSSLREYVEKCEFLLAAGEKINCGVCRDLVDHENEVVVICSQGSCRCASHILCLSTRFLTEEKSSKMVPSSGSCPTCNSKLDWATLMKEVSLRARGENEIRKLKKTRKRNRTAGLEEKQYGESDTDTMDQDDIDELEDGNPFDLPDLPEEEEEDVIEKTSNASKGYNTESRHGQKLNDNWILSLSDESDDYPKAKKNSGVNEPEWEAEVVIDDTDWEDAEIID